MNICTANRIIIPYSRLDNVQAVDKPPSPVVDKLWNKYAVEFSTIGPHQIYRLLERLEENLKLLIQITISLSQLFDLVYRMQHCRVMLVSKFTANLRQ